MPERCYIVGAGDFDGRYFCPKPGDLVIAADGGYNHLARLGVRPDIVLGDFDSLGYVPQHECIVRHPVRKNDTDLGLAVREGLARGARFFGLFGATGGTRLDHTLAAVQTLCGLRRRGAHGYLCGGGQVVTVLHREALAFDAGCRGYVSVLCAGARAAGVFIRGLSYELENAVLTLDMPLGVSNEFTGRPAEVGVRSGWLAVLYQGSPEQMHFKEETP